MTDFKEIKRILTIDYISGNPNNELFLMFDEVMQCFDWIKSTLNDTDYFTLNMEYLSENAVSHHYILYYDTSNNVVWFDRLSFRNFYDRLTKDVAYNSDNNKTFEEEYLEILTIIIQNYLSTKFVEKYPEFKDAINQVKVCHNIKHQTSLIDKSIFHYYGSNHKTT